MDDRALWLVVIWLLCSDVALSQDDEEDDRDPRQQYLGTRLGRFTTFSHQVDGELYAVNTTSFLIKNFYYDGSGRDTYFWVGSSNHANRRAGYPVPDEEGKTNVLKRYANQDLTLTLPDNKLIEDLKWLSIFDVGDKISFAEVVFPEEFEPPGPRILQELTRNSHGVKSDPVMAKDSKTLQITNLNYDGLGPDAYFWVGYGPVPTSKGMKIPDENGYLEPLRPYQQANITLQLPGNMTIFDVDWLSIFNVGTRENYGSMLFPKELNVPPSLVKDLQYYPSLINCEQLHQQLQISWQIGSSSKSVTMELVGQIGLDDYMAFGINSRASEMVGSRVIVAYTNGSMPFVEDYFMTDKSPCFPTPSENGTNFRGVCSQRFSGKPQSGILVQKFMRSEGVTVINFTLPVRPGSLIESEMLGKDLYIVWAIGHLNSKMEPLYHYLRNTGTVRLNLDRQPPTKQCFSFTINDDKKIKPWEGLFISTPQLAVFNFTLGPSAGAKGYKGITGLRPPGLVWYVNGLMAPELYVKRGQKYIFSIEGGDNILEPGYHHPFYITDDKRGGYETLSARDKRYVHFYAGVSFDHKGRPIPTADGRLCIWENPRLNPRNWDEYPSFRYFQAGLRLRCQPGKPYLLEWTPNGTIPSVVYYQSFRQANMGWKIHIVDTIRASGATIVVLDTKMLFISFIFLIRICPFNLLT